MERKSSFKVFIPTLVGALAGFFALHPYTMLVYGIYEKPHPGTAGASGLAHLIGAFNPAMFHMGIPYALLGAAAGLFFVFWRESERHRDEAQKRVLVLRTLKELMVTLSHYLLNASTVIGGYASRAMTKEQDENLKRSIEVIKKESECIEDVVRSLQSVQELETERYIPDSETLIIDITKQLEQRLREHRADTETEVTRKAA